MAQPHERYGLSARRMVVLGTFRAPSLCRRVHRAFMRNALLDYTPLYLQLLATKAVTLRHTVSLTPSVILSMTNARRVP